MRSMIYFCLDKTAVPVIEEQVVPSVVVCARIFIPNTHCIILFELSIVNLTCRMIVEISFHFVSVSEKINVLRI